MVVDERIRLLFPGILGFAAISAAIGASYGYEASIADAAELRGLIRGALAGALIGAAVSSLIAFVLQAPDTRRAPFVVTVVVSSLAYLVIFLAAIGLTRAGALRQKNVTLDGRDDFFAVTGKLGPPTSDRSRETGGLFYRALAYPERRYTVILMGPEQGRMTYIGAMDQYLQSRCPKLDTRISDQAATENALRYQLHLPTDMPAGNPLRQRPSGNPLDLRRQIRQALEDTDDGTKDAEILYTHAPFKCDSGIVVKIHKNMAAFVGLK